MDLVDYRCCLALRYLKPYSLVQYSILNYRVGTVHARMQAECSVRVQGPFVLPALLYFPI